MPTEPVEGDLAPVLGARRDGGAHADSTRGLLMTMLGEYVLPAGGAAWTRTLIAGLDLFDVREKAARQALARMEADGWLQRARVGRETQWSLTARAQHLLAEGAERIYGFGVENRRWDGEWVVLLASVPERERTVRYRMAQRLSWIGFGPLGQGTWICPWTTQESAARDVLSDLGVDATSFRGPVGRVGSGHDLAGRAWPLAELASAYDCFLAEFPAVGDPRDELPAAGGDPAEASGAGGDPAEFFAVDDDRDGADAARDLTRLVHGWRKFPFLDPDLPAELLPEPWPGRAAAARFGALRGAWLAPARKWWAASEAGGA